MDCSELKNAGRFIDGEQSASERAAYQAHVYACAACQQEVARLTRIKAFLSAPAPEVGRKPLNWKAAAIRRKVLRIANVLTAAAAMLAIICTVAMTWRSNNTDAASSGWERVAATQQFDTNTSETEDPLAQAVLQNQAGQGAQP